MICVGNRHFSASVIEWLISAVKKTPSLSRTALSEELCSKLEISLSPVERKNKKKRGDLGDLSLFKGGVTDREHISLESLGKIELKLVKRHDLGPNVKSKGKKLKYFVWSQHQGLVGGRGMSFSRVKLAHRLASRLAWSITGGSRSISI